MNIKKIITKLVLFFVQNNISKSTQFLYIYLVQPSNPSLFHFELLENLHILLINQLLFDFHFLNVAK